MGEFYCVEFGCTDLYRNWVPHLRDGFIVDKVGHFRGSENPDTLQTLGNESCCPR
jgi:hypothetical protein